MSNRKTSAVKIIITLIVIGAILVTAFAFFRHVSSNTFTGKSTGNSGSGDSGLSVDANASTFDSNNLTIADELKKTTYDGIDESNEKYFSSGDIDNASKYLMKKVDDVISSNSLNVSKRERDGINQNIRNEIKSLYDNDNIKTEDGKLTSLSKAYIANAASDSFVSIKPDIDKTARTDAGRIMFKQTIEIDKSINALRDNNQVLVKEAKAIYGDSYTKLSKQLNARVTDAIATNLTTNANNTTDTTAIMNSVQALYNALSEQSASYQQMQSYLESLKKQVTTLEKNNSNMKAEYEKIVQDTADNFAKNSTVNDMSKIIEGQMTNLNQLTESYNQYKIQIESAEKDMSMKITELNNAAQELQEIINNNKAESEKLVSSTKETIEKTLNSEIEKVQSVLEKTNTDTVTKLTETQKEIGDQITNINNTHNTFVEEYNKWKGEQTTTNSDQKTAIDNNKTNIDKITNDISDMKNTTEQNKKDLEDALNKTSTDLTNAIDEKTNKAKQEIADQMPVIINGGEFTFDENGKSQPIKNKALRTGVTGVEINYEEQYDFKPEYTLESNDSEGQITASCTGAKEKTYKIKNIVIYRNAKSISTTSDPSSGTENP